MLWTVTGTDKATSATSAPQSLTLEAPTPQAAGARAVEMGLAVDSVSPAPAIQSPVAAEAPSPLHYQDPPSESDEMASVSRRLALISSRITYWVGVIYGAISVMRFLGDLNGFRYSGLNGRLIDAGFYPLASIAQAALLIGISAVIRMLITIESQMASRHR